ncbi:MAG: hypothetical protein DRP08_03820 [Candidatus Aenigmatarchaeota archaeon]|nr:MAG: hypothetical protein DRP08_03820 [Candidatus Aenigmarchaeota archaeon]
MSEEKQLTKEQQKAMARLAIRRAVAQVSDSLFEGAQGLGEKLRQANLDTGQIRNLENIAYSTDRLSDIYDFLKKQMGRPGKLGQQWRHQGVGQELLDTLTGLRKRASATVKGVGQKYPQGVHRDTERQVHLMLCREYLKHVAAHYLYTGAVE